MCYVRGEYIGTKECLFKFLALRTVIKQFCEVGAVLLAYKPPHNFGDEHLTEKSDLQ